MENFKKVETEIEANRDLFELSESGEIDEFINHNIYQTSGKPLLELKKWFDENPSSWISYNENYITVLYDNCGIESQSYDAHLYYSLDGATNFDKNSIAKIVDSISLGNDWYYILTKCEGCGL